MRSLLWSVVVLCVALGSLTAEASINVYFGEDTGSTAAALLASHPNSAAAETAFFATLASPETESFEGLTAGATPPYELSGGTTTIATQGSAPAIVMSGVSSGRFPVGGSQYIQTRAPQTSSGLLITFDDPQTAIGFYGTDVGDTASVTITLYRDATVVWTGDIRNGGSPISTSLYSLLYFGIAMDEGDSFDSVLLSRGAAGTENYELWGLDLLTIDSPIVPEPASILVWAVLGVFGLVVVGRRASR